MKKYNVEIDYEAMVSHLNKVKVNKFWLIFVPSILVFISSYGPFWFDFLIHQKVNYSLKLNLIVHFIVLNLLTYFTYHFTIKRKNSLILPLLSELIFYLNFFIGAVLYAFTAGLPYIYIFNTLIVFFIVNFCVLHSALTAFGPLIDLRLKPIFTRKDEVTFICNRNREDDEFSARIAYDEIISTTKFGWVVTLVSWSLWLIFPLSFFIFSDIYIQDNEVTSRALGFISVICLTLYLGMRKEHLYQLIACRAILRKQAGY